ncbi:hypothetical protein MNBD_GAMMA12-3923 [hydrothermal vent metagenome]|uniref:Uncharacterized protein n=2 Tax=hydrothermal vent metagenome TaxID=652676 RepID=A0A3B0YQJ7_9ZZZZ
MRRERTISDEQYLQVSAQISTHSIDARISAVHLFAELGSYREVSEMLEIPNHTIRCWSRTQDWWVSILTSVQKNVNDELDVRFSKIIGKSTQKVLDNLENGEEISFRGEIHKKQISAKDAAVVTAIMFDKRQLLRAQPTSISKQTSDERLNALADKMRALDSVLRPAINATSEPPPDVSSDIDPDADKYDDDEYIDG